MGLLSSFRRAVLAGIFMIPAQVQACDLALALAVDVSGSVDTNEFRLQMDGLSEALRDGIISEALVRGQARLMLVQWTGATRQQITIPWTTISDFDALEAFAEKVAQDRRVWRNYSTAIGDALRFTMAEFAEVRACQRLLIDISGDGISNEGEEPAEVHPALKDLGIVVNALAIEESEPDLTSYFFESVITGEGAFVVTARTFEDYPRQIRKKLLREITLQTADLQ